MSLTPVYKEITKDDLGSYEHLILPMVYEELTEQDSIDTEYICIAMWLGDVPVGAIIAEPEGSGDINLLSVWTDVNYRRMGVASALRDKMTEVALNLYDWDEAQYGDDILLKTMYCIADEYRVPFETWLEKNDFTDFAVLHPEEGDTKEIRSATAEIHFFR